MEFQKLNLNPLNNRTNDCVIRALSKALKKDWYRVYDGLYESGRELARMPNDEVAYRNYMKKNNIICLGVAYVNDNSRKRMTVEQFANKHKFGTFIVKIQGHLTVIVDGVLYDTFNCSNNKVGKYYGFYPLNQH